MTIDPMAFYAVLGTNVAFWGAIMWRIGRIESRQDSLSKFITGCPWCSYRGQEHAPGHAHGPPPIVTERRAI